MYKRSKRFLAAGLATTVILSSMIIPAVAAEDYASISLSTRIEEYISETDTTDPVAELLGEENVLDVERKETPALNASGTGLMGIVNSAENVVQSINRIQKQKEEAAAQDAEAAEEAVKTAEPVYIDVDHNVSEQKKEEAAVVETATTETKETENTESTESGEVQAE